MSAGSKVVDELMILAEKMAREAAPHRRGSKEALRAAIEQTLQAEKAEVFRLQCSHSALYAEVETLRKALAAAQPEPCSRRRREEMSRAAFEAWWNMPTEKWQRRLTPASYDLADEAYQAGWQAATEQALCEAHGERLLGKLRADPIADQPKPEPVAKVCESVNNHDNPMTANDCAAAIRGDQP